MKQEKYQYEIIFSDNDSSDNTQEILQQLASEDKRIKVIINQRNYGPSLSPKNALRHAPGDVMISIASDLQDPPEMIPELLRWWEKGYKMVYGQKVSSQEGKMKYGMRSIYYKIINMFSDFEQVPHLSGICLNDRIVMKELLEADEDLYIGLMVTQLGYPIKTIPYEQNKRKSGKSSYNIYRYLNYSIDSLVMSSTRPIRLATIFGVLFAFLCIIISIVYFILKLIYWDDFSVGIVPIIMSICIIGAVQIFLTGLIGEYILVILRRVTKKLPIIEKEIINFDTE